ncbi:MAG: hypothetical protein E7352_04305 [Clostridiales bacterium]|nr:hypothetical protein [Clostridiales bacterium]
MSEVVAKEKVSLWKRFLFSDFLRKKKGSHKIAYIGVISAFSVGANLLVSAFPDSQFSIVMVVALLAGIILGAGAGFVSSVIADGLAWVIYPPGMYMFWVGLATGAFSLLSGLIFSFLNFKFKGAMYVKMCIAIVATFLLCTIGINTTGFYLYNQKMGFSKAVLDYVSKKTGGDVNYWLYTLYRLFFKGQIWNSVFNYALFFVAVPALNGIKPLKLRIK